MIKKAACFINRYYKNSGEFVFFGVAKLDVAL